MSRVRTTKIAAIGGAAALAVLSVFSAAASGAFSKPEKFETSDGVSECRRIWNPFGGDTEVYRCEGVEAPETAAPDPETLEAGRR